MGFLCDDDAKCVNVLTISTCNETFSHKHINTYADTQPIFMWILNIYRIFCQKYHGTMNRLRDFLFHIYQPSVSLSLSFFHSVFLSIYLSPLASLVKWIICHECCCHPLKCVLIEHIVLHQLPAISIRNVLIWIFIKVFLSHK